MEKGDWKLAWEQTELIERVWPGCVVEENNLQVQICALRRAFGPDRDLIRTIPGRGYRFVGALSDTTLQDKTDAPPRPSR